MACHSLTSLMLPMLEYFKIFLCTFLSVDVCYFMKYTALISFFTYINCKILSNCFISHFRLGNFFSIITFCPQNFLYHISGLPILETLSFIPYFHYRPSTGGFSAKLKSREYLEKLEKFLEISEKRFWRNGYKEVFKKIQLKFHVTSKTIGRN